MQSFCLLKNFLNTLWFWSASVPWALEAGNTFSSSYNWEGEEYCLKMDGVNARVLKIKSNLLYICLIYTALVYRPWRDLSSSSTLAWISQYSPKCPQGTAEGGSQRSATRRRNQQKSAPPLHQQKFLWDLTHYFLSLGYFPSIDVSEGNLYLTQA